MAKRSHRPPVRYEKDQLGCMWGLISIFDFRHGRVNRRMLSDRSRAKKLAAGAGNPTNKLGLLTWVDNSQEKFDAEEGRNVAADAGKLSVKKLLEEEMINEQDTENKIDNAEVKPKHSRSEQGSPRKKASKRMRKSQKKSCDRIHELDAPENLSAEQPSHQKSEHQSISTLDIDIVMEEFCHQIHQKGHANQERPGEHVQSNQKNLFLKENMREVIKWLISHKLVRGKQVLEDGEIHPSKELMDALQVLGTDGQLFVEHLQDPNSLLVKCIQNFPDVVLKKDEDFLTLAGSTLEQGLGDVRRSDEPVILKQKRFFRRKVNSQEESPSNGEKTSQGSNRIVILKPGPTGSPNCEAEGTVGSSPESHHVLGSKGHRERIGSHFFLTEIKRKLKYAMGKEYPSIHKRVSYESQELRNRNRGSEESVGINSPRKDDFSMEKIARPVGIKNVDKTSKLKDSELDTEQRNADLPNERVSSIYIEARKHLSEMLSTGNENLDSSGGHVLKTLGRVLSPTEYKFSPVGSPGRNWELDPEKYQKVHENTLPLNQDSPVGQLGQTTKSLESQPCISDDSSDDKVGILTEPADLKIKTPYLMQVDVLDDQPGTDEKEISFSGEDEMNSIGNEEIIKTVVHVKSQVLDAPCQPTKASNIEEDVFIDDEFKICNGQRHCRSTTEDLDASEDSQLPSSMLASPSNSLMTKKSADQEAAIKILKSPSLASLGLLHAEDDNSPASNRSNAGNITLPLPQTQCEEHESPSAAVQCIQMKSSMEDKESNFEYVKAVVQASDFNWDELCMKLFSTDQLLDASLFDEIEFLPNQLCYEQKLLFDLVNEVLMEICGHYFGFTPWVSFIKPYIWPIPYKKNVLREVWEGVLWHLIPLSVPHTLDQTVRKDLFKSRTWMDLRFDADSTCIELGNAILEELMEDCVNECPERGCPVLLAELMDSESHFNTENGCPLLPAELKLKESCD